jgi:hypothetical protein
MNRIPSIPTTYKNVHFRSRLEAKWAAFFDLLGWKWQYEPLDLNGYIPDFALEGMESVLVEVKPAMSITKLEPFTEKLNSIEWSGEILLLGTRPFESLEFDVAGLGLIRENYASAHGFDERAWSRTILAREDSSDRWDFCSETGLYEGRMFGEDQGGFPIWAIQDRPLIVEVASMWAEAGNKVRWKPQR